MHHDHLYMNRDTRMKYIVLTKLEEEQKFMIVFETKNFFHKSGTMNSSFKIFFVKTTNPKNFKQ